MAIDFFSSIDLNKNELQNAVVQNLGSAPGSPVEGQIYYDTGDDTIYFRNGSAWVSIGGDITGVTAGDGMTGGGTTGAVTLNVVGGDGITANADDVAITAAQTTITSVLNTGLVVGRDADNQIKFATDNTMVFRVGAGDGVTFKASGEIEATSLDIGTGGVDVNGTLECNTLTVGGTNVLTGSLITTLGTISAGVWNGTAIASAYLDADTAHLTTAQTFTGSKTFGTTTKLNFRDGNSYIYSPTANDIEIVATTITLDAASDIQLEGNTTVTGNFSISGTLNVDGSTTTVDSTTVAIADSMLKLAKDQNNTTDAVDFGFYGQYGVSGTHKYAGIFRDLSATGDPFTFFDSLQAEPGGTVDTGGTGYDLADISAGGITAADGFTGDLTGDVTGNADTVTTNANLTGHITSSGNAAVLGSFTVAQLSTALSNASISGNNTGDEPDASTSAKGIVELATDAEVLAGSGAAKVVDATQLAAQRSVVATIAQSSLTDDNRVTITHNLGTADVIVQLFDMTTEANVQADIARTTDDMSTASTSVITVDFGQAPANDIRCLITSLKGATTSGTIAYT